ncbi:MAG: pyrroline-5-carboxylate reductase [Myxococcota bacterium]
MTHHEPFIDRLAFVGGGNMAEALIRGLRDGPLRAAPIAVSDIRPDRLHELADRYDIAPAESNVQAVADAPVAVLAVKPQKLPEVLGEVKNHTQGKLIVSVVAGVSSSAIEKVVAKDARVIRAMPNTPALVGAGATAVAPGARAGVEDLALAERLFESVGTVYRVDETQIDAVTGLAGSGPAYVFLFIEALRDAGIAAGLSPEVAGALAAQTVYGAATLLRETEEDPEALRRNVTSPHGTTERGVARLQAERLSEAVKAAVLDAQARSRELGGEFDRAIDEALANGRGG